jgi:hypothetical protein
MITAESKPCTQGQADALTRNEGRIVQLRSRWVQIRLPDSSQPSGRSTEWRADVWFHDSPPTWGQEADEDAKDIVHTLWGGTVPPSPKESTYKK